MNTKTNEDEVIETSLEMQVNNFMGCLGETMYFIPLKRLFEITGQVTQLLIIHVCITSFLNKTCIIYTSSWKNGQ